MGRIFYRDIVLDVSDNVYEPREDSFLLADNLKIGKSKRVLEIGTGSGLLSILAAKFGAKKIVATDINEKAVECARKNAELNKVSDKIEFKKGDLFAPIKGDEKFDLIIFNPPYLPKEKKYTEKLIDLSYNGTKAMQKFLKEYKKFLKNKGRALIINSSISEVPIPENSKILAEKKLAFEEIFVIELKS